MNLEQAIAYLDAHHTTKFTAADRATIKAVATELGSLEFEGRQDGAHVTDVEGLMHIHPTMIVTARPVKGSARTDTYPQWPHRVELSRWADRSAAQQKSGPQWVPCPDCLNPMDERHADGCY